MTDFRLPSTSIKMAENQNVSRTGVCNKEERKAQRKLNKLIKKANQHCNIEYSATPTTVIMIGNAGLTTGILPLDLLTVFMPHGLIEDIIMLPGKSFSFVIFKNLIDASKAMKNVHGKQVSNFENPLYLTFVVKVPDVLRVPSVDIFPPGLSLIENAVSDIEEALLLNDVKFDGHCPSSIMKNRIVKHFGYEFLYETNTVDCEHPLENRIPSFCEELLSRFLQKGYISYLPNQLTVNQYQPGHGIPLHIDTHSAFEDEILSLSLGSGVMMDFKNSDGEQRAVLLPRRSLLVMSGESRYNWSHGIAPRKTDIIRDPARSNGLNVLFRGVRTSFTFRKIRREVCRCIFPDRCDSQNGAAVSESKLSAVQFPEIEKEAKRLENLHVHKVYEEIADHFCHTRHKPWPRIKTFIESLPPGTILLDLGCGNGKYLNINPLVFKVGCDRSRRLVNICNQRGFHCVCCDALSLPMRSEAFDACLCIAVIHHFASMERRVQVLREIARILKNGGKALVYVWALEQQIGTESSNYIKPSRQKISKQLHCEESPVSCIMDLGDSTLSSSNVLSIHTNRTSFEQQDVLVPWHLKGESNGPSTSGDEQIFHRFYHVFQDGELEKLCEKVPQLTVIENYYDKGNWCAVLQKEKQLAAC